MRRLLLAGLVVLALVGTAQAENTGETLLQCVTVSWNAPETYPPSIAVEVMVFGKVIAEDTLTPKHKALEFEFVDGFVLAKGRLDTSFVPYDGVGKLSLTALEASCDLTGVFPIKPRPLADFKYEAKFDY